MCAQYILWSISTCTAYYHLHITAFQYTSTSAAVDSQLSEKNNIPLDIVLNRPLTWVHGHIESKREKIFVGVIWKLGVPRI